MRLITKIQLTILDNLVWVLLILFFIFNVLFTKNFFSLQNQINIVYQTTVVGMLVLAQGIVMMVGELDLSIDSMLAFAPGVAVLFFGNILNPELLIIATLMTGAMVGLFNGLFVTTLHA